MERDIVSLLEIFIAKVYYQSQLSCAHVQQDTG